MKKYKGVYAIKNAENGKMYIGSSLDIIGRTKAHLSALVKNKHKNYKLQRAWNKSLNPELNFKFSILRIMNLESEEEIRSKEEYFIDFYSSVKYGYNISSKANPFKEKGLFAGDQHPLYGKSPSQSTRNKASLSMKKFYKENPDIKESISNRFKGKNLKKEHKLKISKSLKGKTAWLGQKHSEASKLKMSHIVKEKFKDSKRKQIHSNAMSGRKFSEESKMKIKERHKGEGNPNSKLNSEKVKEICILLNQGKKSKEISSLYSVSEVTINRIKYRKAWKDISDMYMK